VRRHGVDASIQWNKLKACVSGGKAKLKLKNNPVFLIHKIVKPT
jgi:hypothetical protein